MSTRDEIRSQILGTEHKPKSEPLEFFGAKIELRQPPLEAILKAQGEDDRKVGLVSVLLNQAYVPETDEKVFEDADIDMLLALPFGPDYIRVSQALEKLSEVNFTDGKLSLSSIQPLSASTESPGN